VLNVTAGEGWDRLCPFLGKPEPDIPFPKANVTQIRWMKMEDLVAVAEEAGRALLQRYEGELAPEVQRTRAGAPSAGVRLLGRAMQAALGRDAAEAAMKASYKAAVAGLKKLNPTIAIVAPAEEPASYAERKNWNHLWLVDPLDGREAFASGSADFSVNLALIEDGRPIYGVVHAPAKGVTYYARSGKGAFKRPSGGEAIGLARTDATAFGTGTVDAGVQTGKRTSMGLALCRLLEEGPASSPVVGQAMEWTVAPADAILAAAGLRVCEPASQRSLRYNQKTLLVDSALVKA
jgi:3'(2'), 5'-bisphosphate nucleotidase